MYDDVRNDDYIYKDGAPLVQRGNETFLSRIGATKRGVVDNYLENSAHD